MKNSLIEAVVAKCLKVGAKPKLFAVNDYKLAVALGHEWMDMAACTGTKEAALVNELVQMSSLQTPVECCASIAGFSVSRLN